MNTTALPAGYGISVTLEATPHQFGNVLELIRSSDNEMGNIYASLEQALKVSQNSVSVEVLKSEIESQGRTIRRTSRKELLILPGGKFKVAHHEKGCIYEGSEVEKAVCAYNQCDITGH